jgi:hypothetical protein
LQINSDWCMQCQPETGVPWAVIIWCLLKPIFFKLFWPSTRLVNIYEGTCPNCWQLYKRNYKDILAPLIGWCPRQRTGWLAAWPAPEFGPTCMDYLMTLVQCQNYTASNVMKKWIMLAYKNLTEKDSAHIKFKYKCITQSGVKFFCVCVHARAPPCTHVHHEPRGEKRKVYSWGWYTKVKAIHPTVHEPIITVIKMVHILLLSPVHVNIQDTRFKII